MCLTVYVYMYCWHSSIHKVQVLCTVKYSVIPHWFGVFSSYFSPWKEMKQFFLIFLSVSWVLMLPFAMFGLEPCRKWPMLQNVSLCLIQFDYCMNIPCCYVFGFLSSHYCLRLWRVLSTQDVNNLSRVNKIIWFYQLGW